MAIFGRKKLATTTTTTSLPSAPMSSQQQPDQRQQYELPQQPDWAYVEQRPTDSDGTGSQPQGWLIAPVPPQYQPVFTAAPPLPQRPKKSSSKLDLSSMSNLLANNVPVPASIPGALHVNNGVGTVYMTQQGTQYLSHGAALCDLISSKFDDIITLIDGERFSGDEKELAVFAPPQPMWQQQQQQEHSGYAERDISKGKGKGMVNNGVSSALTSTNYFAKANLYANSRLPPDLPPMKLYLETFRLLNMAAKFSERVYAKPSGQEREEHVDPGWRAGTKAMVIKSCPMDDSNTIVFAIRGTQTFMDWTVNLNSAPSSAEGFLDDPGNLCHAGFLTVARKMIRPVADRLKHLLQEDPSRAQCSLLITGHSAGGAVAALLYSHMLATSPKARSELNILTGFFKRIHCISFGAPPVSLLPLTKPQTPELRKSLFYSFVNEGDPVPRADKSYVRSLLDLYTSPAPGTSCAVTAKFHPLASSLGVGNSSSTLTLNRLKRTKPKRSRTTPAPAVAPVWPVPEATLSNAGRIILLRGVQRYADAPKKKLSTEDRMNEGVVAQMVSDELLRGVVWGDPVMHMMALYAQRIKVLATNAVMGVC